MNEEISVKEHMKETFRAMLLGMERREKTSVNIETINKYTNPSYKHTIDDSKRFMQGLMNARYIRFKEFLEKRYYAPSKLGTERWNAHLGSTLHELTIEAEKRKANTPPWEEAQ